jgi:mannose-6-phosphate isomerase-like protein (cupin superfamily)
MTFRFRWLFAFALVALFVAAGDAQTPAPAGPPSATPPLTTAAFFDHTKVNDALAKGGYLATTTAYIVQGSHRDVGGQVEQHDKETDVLYITDGAATFVYGGKMVGGKVSRPGQWLGTDITGGQTQKLVKGDVMIVPAGIPHWFKSVEPNVSYFVVKSVKP